MATAPTLFWYQLDSGTLAATYFGQLDAAVAALCADNSVTAPSAPWENSIGGTLLSQWQVQIDTAVRALCTALTVDAPIALIAGSSAGQYQSEYLKSLDGVVRALCAVEPPYVASAVHFDGATSLSIASLTATGDDTGYFSKSLWLKGLNNGGILWAVDPADTFTSQSYATTDHIYADFTDAAAGDSFNVRPTETPSALTWHNLHISVQTNLAAGNKIRWAYLDDVALTLGSIDNDPAFTLTFNGLPFFAFDDSFADFWQGDIADCWIAPGQYIDFSVAANRRKFISSTGKPVDLGADGSAPTGTPPAIFFSGDATGFATNKGTGGAFTLTGALTNASTSPSD